MSNSLVSGPKALSPFPPRIYSRSLLLFLLLLLLLTCYASRASISMGESSEYEIPCGSDNVKNYKTHVSVFSSPSIKNGEKKNKCFPNDTKDRRNTRINKIAASREQTHFFFTHFGLFSFFVFSFFLYHNVPLGRGEDRVQSINVSGSRSLSLAIELHRVHTRLSYSPARDRSFGNQTN